MHDPMKVFRDALEAHGCAPTGTTYKATAKCPAHEDGSPSLSVAEGVDGRVVFHCHAGCEPRAVVGALGLSWGDLFPDGHRQAGQRRRPSQPAVETGEPITEILAALMTVGISVHTTLDHRLYIADRCPGCDENRPGALWISHDPGSSTCPGCSRPHGRVKLTCWNECGFSTILAALEHEMTANERAAA